VEYKKYPKDTQLSNGTWNVYEHNDFYTVLFKDTHGHVGSLTDHQITDDGTVSPSVVCSHYGCDFHEWIILDGWTSIPR
jgi:hypothetical protein